MIDAPFMDIKVLCVLLGVAGGMFGAFLGSFVLWFIERRRTRRVRWRRL